MKHSDPFAGVIFDNSYARLPEHFYVRQAPVPVRHPSLIRINHALAQELGLDSTALESELGVAVFAGNHIPEGANPLAMAYAGHQFGHFVPRLGDGRATLLGEIIDPGGTRRDIHLKGSGQTAYSRQGDGRAAIGPVIREYIVSEAMHALGIPTTRSLAAVMTGEPVFRETVLPGAILTRVAASHIRIGTFEYFAARGDIEALKLLADHVIARHYPELKLEENPYLALLGTVMAKQSRLVAGWMHVGFIHGVMNTDNMSVSGETIDYGPCAFMDRYDPDTVFSSIDRVGRYAYGNQGRIAQWNLARFAETLLPLLDADIEKAAQMAEASIHGFPARFEQDWLAGMRRKFGLLAEEDGDRALIEELLGIMEREEADFTLGFRALCSAAEDATATAFQSILGDRKDLDRWLIRWWGRLEREAQTPPERAASMRAVNPIYIPRNHQVERAIVAATISQDFTVMDELLKAVINPYDEQEDYASYSLPPKPEERVLQTFCGT